MRQKNNKKAQSGIYPLFVAVFTIIALLFAINALNNTKKVVDVNGRELFLGEKQTAVFAAVQDADSVNLFIDKAAELSAQQAVSKIRNSCFVSTDAEADVDELISPCGKYVYPQWSTNESLCLPDCETAFLNAFKDDFLVRTENYFQRTGVELPISYNLQIEAFEDHFTLRGKADSTTGFNVLSMEARIKNPVARMLEYKGGRLAWPVETSAKAIHSCYGWRKLDDGEIDDHPGIDITALAGTPIIASASGKVVAVDRTCWGRVVINHGSGLSTEYVHMGSISVNVDQEVAQGERIGTVGGRGKDDYGACKPDAYPPHLHFAVLYKGVSSGLDYKGQSLAIHSFGTTDHIQPECLLDSGYSRTGTGCGMPVNTELEEVCEKYNLPKEFLEPTPITGNEEVAALTGRATQEDEKAISTDYGTYSFKPGFTTRVNKKITDPLKPVTDWFKETWDSCTGEEKSPGECLNKKMAEFNEKSSDYRISFADRCEDYPLFYDMMEFFEDCFSDRKYACSCEFDLAKAKPYSRKDMSIVFDVETKKATLFVKEKIDGKEGYQRRGEYEFYYGRVKPILSTHTSYVLFLDFDESTGSLKSARLSLFEAGDNPAFDTYTFKDYTTIKIDKPDKADEALFMAKSSLPSCEYNKNKFRLCAVNSKSKDELLSVKFSLMLKDKPPEPVKEGDVKLIETDIDTKSLLDKIPGVVNLLANIYPTVGYLLTAAEIYDAINAYTDKPQNLQVIVDVPKDKDGKPLDVAGYEVYCNDFLTQVLPKDVLDTYKPSHFVVMANQELNQKVSQLDNYVKTNSYSDFLDLKDCNVPVSKSNGETVLVPGLKGVYKDGKMVFNLNKCGDLSMIIGKFLGKNYCVSLVPVDKNGNKMTDYAVSNCVQTNSLLDLVVDEMLKKELGNFIPADLIPEDLKPYIKLPDTNDLVDMAMGKKDFDMADLVNSEKLSSEVKDYLESFVVDTINKDIIGTSLINSVEDLNIWEKQVVMSTLSNQIKDEDAKFLFDSFVSGGDVSTSVQQMAMQKGIDYIDSSKAPEILKEIAKGEEPESLAYQELLRIANEELSSDEKKQDLLDLASSSSGEEVRDKLIAKAVEKGCSEDYGITPEQAMNCLGADEIDAIYSEMLNDYQTADQAKQELLNKAVDRLGENAPSALKELVMSGDIKGLAQEMLQEELNNMPDSTKKQFINDVLEGRMPGVEALQSEIMKRIPALDNEYVNALLRDGSINALIKDKLESYLKSQLNSFLQGECVPVQNI